MTKSKAKPKATKRRGGIPLDELVATHAAGRPAKATKKTPARASASAFGADIYQRRPCPRNTYDHRASASDIDLYDLAFRLISIRIYVEAEGHEEKNRG